jgi:hypothetical protein
VEILERGPLPTAGVPVLLPQERKAGEGQDEARKVRMIRTPRTAVVSTTTMQLTSLKSPCEVEVTATTIIPAVNVDAVRAGGRPARTVRSRRCRRGVPTPQVFAHSGSPEFECVMRAAGCYMNRMINEPLERLRIAARRTRELALNRASTGLGHEDDDGVAGTIGTDAALGFDPFPLLEALHHHGARAVVIGQVAGIMHGSTELTGDLDLLWDGDRAHAPSLAAAFAAVDAQLSDERGSPLATRPDSLLRPKVQFTSAGASGDCCTPELAWGGLQVRECLDRAIIAIEAGGMEVRYVSREDLIRMRRAIGRPKDLRRAAELDSFTSDRRG